MIKEEFSDLNIIYKAMGKNVGRCKAGNKALELASGKYLNFLDDDDLFYPDHVETLVGELENANEKIAYTTAFETPIIVHSKEPYKYSIVNENVVYSTEFNILKLLYCNIVPIQAVMFNREVYEKCGGFDEKLDALEDWELWLRFALDYSFKYIQRTTSIYRVPADKDEIIKRGEFLTKYLEIVRKKYQDTTIEIKGKDVPEFYEYMVKANVNPKNERLKKILRIFKIIK